MSEFGPPEVLYPAEQHFEPPKSEMVTPTQCTATYGLELGHNWTLLRCALGVHNASFRLDGREKQDRSWHAAPLLDGNFHWPPGVRGAPPAKL